MDTEKQDVMRRLSLLLNLSLERGCMPGEVEVAAYKIGSLVQKYGLVVSFPSSHAEEQAEPLWRKQKPSGRAQRAQAPAVPHVEVIVIGETEKALFCRSQEDEAEFWIPRSQCRNGCERWTRNDSGLLYVSRWWAEKEGWV